MTELSPEARALIRAGSSVLRPSAGDRARIRASLAGRLGAAVVITPGTAGASPAKSLLTWPNMSALALGVGVAGMGAFLALREPAPAPQPLPATRLVATTANVPARPSTAVVAVSPARAELAPPEKAAPSPPEQRRAALPVVDGLAEEVSILSRATSALRASRPADALTLLDEHQRKFPNGRLAEERRGARVQALCALGRRPEAESALARLEKAAPRSPHVTRARKACGFGE